MLFKQARIMININIRFALSIIYVFVCILFITAVFHGGGVKAELLERVVAVVNDDAILLSEFRKELKIAREENDEVTKDEVLQDMINREIILDQIKRFNLGKDSKILKNADDRILVKRYIDRRVKSLIYIPFEEIESYYISHKEKYRGRELHEVKAEIESEMRQERLQDKLDDHMAALRKSTYIRIQLNPKDADTAQPNN